MLAQKYNEIPKDLLVYLLRAYDEFEDTKKNYLVWMHNLNLDLARLSEEEKKKVLANPAIPELSVKVPLDEDEAVAIQPEDW